MSKSLRKALKIVGFSLGSIFFLFSLYLGLLFYPGVLFANQIEYKNFTVHSDQDLTNLIEPVLKNVETRLETSAIYDPALKHDIFFGQGNALFTSVQRVRAELLYKAIGLPPALTYNASLPPYLSHIVTFRVPDFHNNALVHPHGPDRVDMTHTLTHEVVHSLVNAKLGIQRVTRLPLWKYEGYPEYVAASATRRASGYAIRDSVSRVFREDLRWLRDPYGNFTSMRYDCVGRATIHTDNGIWPTCYLVARILMEYVLDVKGLTFEQAMSPAVTDIDVLNELLAAYNAGRL